VASLTKMANAVVVLRDHPLVGDAPGPTITVTAADVAEYQFDLHNDESTVPIEAGEQLTERQMLEAMLTQSANDVAYSLALWDAGSEPAFVAKMNALAASLGATSTHFVDATGYDPDSRSTAADLLRIAAAGMAVPAFADTVSLTSVTLPLLGTVPNIVPQIGTDGIVGIKSGYTSHAGGCMVLAAYRVLDGRRVLVLAAVVAQPTPPPIVPPTTTTTTTAPRPTTTTAPPTTVPGTPTTTTTTTTTEPPTTTTTIPIDDRVVPDPEKYAAPAATALLDAARAAVVRADVVARGEALGTVTTRWGDTDHRVEVVAAAAAWLAAWPGQRASGTVTLVTVPPGASTGTRVGTARFTLGTQQVGVPVQLAGTVPEPDWWWRLLHAG
jgi:D-alanyl-D-alanine carboxypeptidase (penicillin-binding protein 5/6)